ncbi:transposase, MuDR, MULE transposase domain protein [Tanacetum coccineum]
MNSPPNHEWEEGLDIDDSDLRLTPVVHPSNNPHIVPEITTTTQTLKFIEDVGEDDDFMRVSWLSVLDYVNVDGRIVTGCFGDVEKFLKNGKLEKVVAVIKSCTPNALGDLTVTLKDLSGTISDTIHYKVLIEERFAKAITV